MLLSKKYPGLPCRDSNRGPTSTLWQAGALTAYCPDTGPSPHTDCSSCPCSDQPFESQTLSWNMEANTERRITEKGLFSFRLSSLCVKYPRERSGRIKTQKRCYLVFLSVEALLVADPNECWFVTFFVFFLCVNYTFLMWGAANDTRSIFVSIMLYLSTSFHWSIEQLICGALMFWSSMLCPVLLLICRGNSCLFHLGERESFTCSIEDYLPSRRKLGSGGGGG